MSEAVEFPPSVLQAIEDVSRRVYAHPEVEALFVDTEEDGMLDWWVIVAERERAVLARLAKTHDELTRKYLLADEIINLNFSVIYRAGRDLGELMPGGVHVPKAAS